MMRPRASAYAVLALGDQRIGFCAWPWSVSSFIASAAGPDLSLSALSARLLRAGRWKPYDCAKSSWSSVWSTHSHFTNFFDASTCFDFAFTQAAYAPIGTLG